MHKPYIYDTVCDIISLFGILFNIGINKIVIVFYIVISVSWSLRRFAPLRTLGITCTTLSLSLSLPTSSAMSYSRKITRVVWYGLRCHFVFRYSFQYRHQQGRYRRQYRYRFLCRYRYRFAPLRTLGTTCTALVIAVITDVMWERS